MNPALIGGSGAFGSGMSGSGMSGMGGMSGSGMSGMGGSMGRGAIQHRVRDLTDQAVEAFEQGG